jgi:hypothetical protein
MANNFRPCSMIAGSCNRAYNEAMKSKPEPIEGPRAFAAFDALVRQVLSVPHEEIMRREAEYKRQSAANPHRRGPKPKTKGGVS